MDGEQQTGNRTIYKERYKYSTHQELVSGVVSFL